MKYKYLLMLLIAFNHVMLNAKTFEELLAEANIAVSNAFAKKPDPKESWSTCATLGALSIVGGCCSYLLHKNKQYHEQKFEDARYQLQIRGIVIREEKNFFADILRTYRKPRHPETKSYLKQLEESYQAKHYREQWFQSALVITLTTGISALLMSKNRLMN